jgi:hypothetical protein
MKKFNVKHIDPTQRSTVRIESFLITINTNQERLNVDKIKVAYEEFLNELDFFSRRRG